MAHKDLESAEDLLKRSRYPEAIERFRVLLSQDPENPELRARCGEAYRLAGNAERAFHHYNKGAAIYARLGEHPKALQLLLIANTLSANEPDILFRIAESKKLVNDLRDFEPILRQLVQAARGAGDRRRLWALDELCHKHPEDLDLASRRAETLAEAGRINDAITAWKLVSARADQRGIDFVPMLQRAASIAPDKADVGIDLAGVLLANRRPREALVLLVPYYEKFPDDAGILETLLRALEALGASDKIIPARIELLKARAKRGQREAALKEIQVLLHIAPDEVGAIEVCAHAYAAFGETGEAIAMWRRLANLYDRTGRKFERDRAILMLLKTNPDDEEALTLGARALHQAGRHGEADVLENRLTLLKRMRARNVIPQRRSERPRAVEAERKQSRSDQSVLSSPTARQTDERDSEEDRMAGFVFNGDEATMPPESIQPEELSLLEPSEQSEPSLEPLPIARNPWSEEAAAASRTRRASGPNPLTEGLDLDPVRARTPSLIEDAQKVTHTFLALDQINAPTAPLGRGVSDAASAIFDDERPIGSGAIAIEDGQIESEIMAGDLALLELPIEAPGGAEETTSKMAELVNDEILELRRQLAASPDPRSTAKTRAVTPRPSSPARHTLRQKLRADLFEHDGKAKKL